MNKYYRAIKGCVMVFCSCCIVFSSVFLAQIQEQKRQIQILQNLKIEVEWTRLQSEKENTGTVAQLEKEMTQTAQELVNKRQLLWKYEKNGQVMKELEERILALQSYYDKGAYLDSLAAELDRENESKSCIERYYKIEKGELEKVLGETDAFDKLKADFPDAEDWGYLLPVGDRIWVQYDVDDSPNALPMGVVIQNPLIDIGYKDARAGMYLYDIKNNYPESAVEEAKLERGTIRYLRYADNEFIYYYVAVDGYGDAVIVNIVPNNG
ncbi:MAG: hypothetical protein K2N37_02565 [Lachnospiraceae bacterium]|nr:hypothetical protein [Lachnospiraceae bacterium]